MQPYTHVTQACTAEGSKGLPTKVTRPRKHDGKERTQVSAARVTWSCSHSSRKHSWCRHGICHVQQKTAFLLSFSLLDSSMLLRLFKPSIKVPPPQPPSQSHAEARFFGRDDASEYSALSRVDWGLPTAEVHWISCQASWGRLTRLYQLFSWKTRVSGYS